MFVAIYYETDLYLRFMPLYSFWREALFCRPLFLLYISWGGEGEELKLGSRMRRQRRTRFFGSLGKGYVLGHEHEGPSGRQNCMLYMRVFPCLLLHMPSDSMTQLRNLHHIPPACGSVLRVSNGRAPFCRLANHAARSGDLFQAVYTATSGGGQLGA